MPDDTTKSPTCACGCGGIPSPGKRFCHGHNGRIPLADRFWAMVDRRGPDECWEWQGARDAAGYGRINIDQENRLATHVSLQLAGRPVPDGMCACHHCDNPPCVNPYHLWIGSRGDNLTDAAAKGRMPHGEDHPWAKLTTGAVREIRRRYAGGGITQDELAAEYGVTQATIGPVIRRETWRHVK